MTSRRGYCGERPEVWSTTVLRLFGIALERVTADSDVADEGLREAVNALDNVVRYGIEVDGLLLARFLTRLAQVSVSAGEHGDRFDELDLISVIDRSLPLAAANGLPTWPLHVAKASYHSRQEHLEEGRASRREALREARNACAGNRDEVEVGLMLAQHHIDLCQYREADRLLARCRRLCEDDPSCADRRAELPICYGNLRYVQGALRTALHHFQSALDAAGDPVPAPAHRAAMRAHHYNGKILAVLGRHQEALGQLLRMGDYPCLSESERMRRAGFLHLRLGEVLTSAGSLDEAYAHLAESRRAFGRLRESGTAQAILDAAVATLHMRRGRRQDALAVLAGAVATSRRNGYRRGVVLFESKAALCRLRERDLPGALRSASAALAAWIRLNGVANLPRAAVGAVEYVGSALIHRVRRRAPRPVAEVRCPCEDCRARRDESPCLRAK
ncbi:hypothetical protein [Streptomyces sp. 4R-3d]|uniref:hypothetical protein n=1 Tax=Streptomyces sp. 4R-3d TaxID=2559605 RepID=UPI001071AA99|nr:hypothetical protein [Streptomyces sp. 4R-3d]TFI30575.1 hypothetical protein E4P36_02085 [Streptomyces sp. 4R-3d]